MLKLSEEMRERRAKKQAKIAARPVKKPDINNRMMAFMLLPNERIQAMILEGASSTYVPVPKGDHRIMANIDRFRKNQKRMNAWTGLRA